MLRKRSKSMVRQKKCTKNFPKEFLDDTLFVEDGYVLPRRPDDGQECEKILDKGVCSVFGRTNCEKKTFRFVCEPLINTLSPTLLGCSTSSIVISTSKYVLL